MASWPSIVRIITQWQVSQSLSLVRWAHVSKYHCPDRSCTTKPVPARRDPRSGKVNVMRRTIPDHAPPEGGGGGLGAVCGADRSAPDADQASKRDIANTIAPRFKVILFIPGPDCRSDNFRR